MSKEIEFQEVMWAEQVPDVYIGAKCDEIKPQWLGCAKGDKDGTGPIGDAHGRLILDCKTFPAGSKVVISEPICPKCNVMASCCACGFDWEEWAKVRFS